MKATDNETTKRNYRYYTMLQTNTHQRALKCVLMHILLLGIILLSVGVSSASVGYSTINLINYNNNQFINISSSIPLTDHVYDLKMGATWLSIPANTTITNARSLMLDIGINCVNCGKWNTTSQLTETYSCIIYPFFYVGANFDITSYDGFEIVMMADTVWTLKGLYPTNPLIQYNTFNYKHHVGTNIIRPNWRDKHD